MTPRDPAIGERIRARRLLRGWSVRYAAGRAGLSHATWSRIERGMQAADNRFTLAAIAESLECTPDELAGAPVAAGPRPIAVDSLRQVLLAEPSGDREPADLVRRVASADSMRRACDYAGLAALLPDLLLDLYAAGRPRMLCDVAFIASSMLRDLGHPAEAWIAAERCRAAAEETGDPLLVAYAAYSLASAARACGSPGRGLSLASSAAAEIAGRPGSDELAGSLHLICAYAADDLHEARHWAASAASLARRTGETTTKALYFGPTNVAFWRIGLEAASGDPGRAAEIARHTDAATVKAGFRQVYYYADTARALARLGQDVAALRFLLTAERVAPQHVRASSSVRETARGLLARPSAGSALRGLYARLGPAA